jgi:ATP-binding cassette, subfamily B, bacterial PglK
MKTSLFKILRQLLSYKDKILLLILLVSSIFISIIETISVSALMVFISIATNFGFIAKNSYTKKFYLSLGFSQYNHFIIFLGIGLILFYGVRFLLNSIHIYYMSKFAQTRQHSFAAKMFNNFLLLNYKKFVLNDQAKMHQTIIGHSAQISAILTALLTIMAEFFTVFCIYAMLFMVNWKMTLILTIFLSIKVYFVVHFFSNRIQHAGKKSQQYALALGRATGNTFNNYKFLKLLSHNEILLKRFSDASRGLSLSNTVNLVWQSLPRFVLETIGFSILISVILYVIYMYNNASSVIPTVAMYALAFYRFLPSVNKIIASYNQILFNQHAIEPIQNFLKIETEQQGTNPLFFNKVIILKSITFSYNKKSIIFDNTSATFQKGEKIGFIGDSGAGKSTLVDIIMGLLQLEQGSIIVDNIPINENNLQTWRRLIGYIPQSIFLFKGTVAENIVCGRLRNDKNIISALKKAQIYDFLQQKEGMETSVGDGGILLSGGQKQRIAIARALYDDPDILVLDEATSALDNKTEAGIMNEIYDIGKEKTLFIVAHRLSTIDRCNKVYCVKNQKIFDITHSYFRGSRKTSISLM